MHAFEPQPLVFQNLCANVALNGLSNVYTYNSACAAEPGSIVFPDLNYAVEGNFGAVSLDRLPEEEHGMRIQIVPLDFNKFAGCDLLKIDAEGMELDVLQGAAEMISNHRPILYLENDRLLKSSSLIGYIMEMDYRLWWHLPPYFNPNNWAQNPHNPWPNMVSYNMLCVPRSRDPLIDGLAEITETSQRPLHIRKA